MKSTSLAKLTWGTITKHKWIPATVAILIIAVPFAGLIRIKNGEGYTLFRVQTGPITQEVSASGAVESPSNIDLAFNASGKLTSLPVSAGSSARQGQIIARLDIRQLEAQIAGMQAGLDLQKAKLDQLIAGATPEDVSMAETAVSNAEVSVGNAQRSLMDAKQNLVDKLRDAYTKADDAARGKADQMFSNPRSANPKIVFLGISQLENDTEWGRLVLESGLGEWKSSLDQLTTNSDLVEYVSKARGYLNQVRIFLDNMALIVNNPNTIYVVDGTSADIPPNWKTDISTARTNINTALSNISTAEANIKTSNTSLNTAQGNLKTAQDQLTLKKSPPRGVDIDVYKAQIAQAEASLDQVIEQKNDYTIYAPVSGIITDTKGEPGENIAGNSMVISMIPDKSFQITIDVSENNVALIKVGQNARIKLDAFNSKEWTGTVAHIDPAGTDVSGAIYYKTDIVFNQKDEDVRPGMTANVWIVIATKESALFIPAGAINIRDGKKYVTVFTEGQAEEREVTTGINDSKGNIEILANLAEGEQIVLSQK